MRKNDRGHLSTGNADLHFLYRACPNCGEKILHTAGLSGAETLHPIRASCLAHWFDDRLWLTAIHPENAIATHQPVNGAGP
jgi:hypothetical protein